jgi:CheY-like chemotaxis protein
MVKVMVVEDDTTMNELLTTLLNLEGFEVTSFSREEEILDTIKRDQPDLILLDVHLRIGGGVEINGFELLIQIRSDDAIREKKVIMSSGIDFRQKCEEIGVDGFLLKPFMPNKLIEMIKELVE